ncbi:hypothetical protein [Roseinatronobacter alkalisoli]|uniref:Uncharacterized protein n=1 Tax=Roseinatronobacter alkalisoli TaxID=3028235 RepID=A0ABT5TFI8_9RHOB|nr:hypothetical protein [Roseinatronobacter sp. HJB301]MDD7973884.1 hypothetical protein [Roseinatronobacter sp. HJB301]
MTVDAVTVGMERDALRGGGGIEFGEGIEVPVGDALLNSKRDSPGARWERILRPGPPSSERLRAVKRHSVQKTFVPQARSGNLWTHEAGHLGDARKHHLVLHEVNKPMATCRILHFIFYCQQIKLHYYTR